ncbi:CbbY [Haematobacter missouriensis]|uniref:Phosphatase n=1 Tax=Haematobacter missouriensis TaxID=366616 RepID=A0A212ATH7_9RHOB|nr:HAD-IA family hydrolase [Haematobacter missouriensis]KFI26284.1 CbbY [Haematobacter missouriensis]OWJ78020.1 phosphatase [Haematobacter missouriensis]OWJ84773.1 phosphatase [Haematobacter missouriensis]
MPEHRWPRALIFDVDGTLAETEALHLAAFNETFAARGLSWNWSRDQYRDLLTTTGGKERISRFLEEIGETPEDWPVAALHAEKTRRFGLLLAQGIPLRPGIAALVAEARAAGCLLGVATTTTPANVEALCRAGFGVGAGDVFDAVAAGDMVRDKKPAPDVYRLALSMLGVAAGEAVAFEDSRNGVLSAREAGIPVILSQGVFTQGEAAENPTLQLSCFSDLGGLTGLRTRLGKRTWVAA